MEVGGFVGDEPGGSFLQPTDVAVYEGRSPAGDDGNILVVEGSHRRSRVQRLDPDGNFERAWGGDGSLDRPSALAVNPSNGDVYVVDSGNRRIAQFDLDGRPLRSWSLAVGAAPRGYGDATVAVAPSEPHHVFVADQAHDRVLQFDSGGAFLRAWGVGVASGARRFETCTREPRCRPGRAMVRFARPRARWPSQIAVDADGVVYGSVFFGAIFHEQPLARTEIARFRSAPPPPGPDAGDALLAPLTPRPPNEYGQPLPDDAYLTDGTTQGLDVDPATGRLFAINNPFGPSVLDVVRDPGAAGKGRRPSTRSLSTLPFLQNVSGIAVTGRGRVVLLSSGAIHQPAGSSTFTGCARGPARRDCHGLTVLAAGGAPAAVAAPALRNVGPAALVNPHGAARYRLQVSPDGRRWRSLGRPRHVIGDEYEQISAPALGLRRGSLYRARVEIEKRTIEGFKTTVVELGASIARAAERAARAPQVFW